MSTYGEYFIVPVQTPRGLRYAVKWNTKPHHLDVTLDRFTAPAIARAWMADQYPNNTEVPPPSTAHVHPQAVPASLPYTSGSATSMAAAADAQPGSGKQRARIYAYLVEHGPHMYEEIAHACGIHLNSVSTRLTQMRDAGMVDFHRAEVDGEQVIATRDTKQGSKAALYAALPEPWVPRERVHTRGTAYARLVTAGGRMAALLAAYVTAQPFTVEAAKGAVQAWHEAAHDEA